jgi:class 3 adenylate cyclase
VTKTVLIPQLSEIISSLDSQAQAEQPSPILQTVAFFDLSGSTSLKLTKGHAVGTAASLRFMIAASQISKACGGVVVKELGDGLLARFDDPVDGCRAALNLKALCRKSGILASMGLTIGRVSLYGERSGIRDIQGDAIDRCARIQSLAYPGQILIDEALYDVAKTHLVDLPDVAVGAEFQADARGIGRLRLWEISLQRLGLVNRIMTPFQVYPAGRMSIEEKVQFMSRAETEVVEIGTGLTAFAKYFTGQKPAEWRSPVRELLRRGVFVRCYAADPEYPATKAYLDDCGDTDYEEDSKRARRMIIRERNECIAQNLPGALEYNVYRRVPEFHCICVDGNDPVNGRILISPYLPGVSRSECPVYQVSAIADRELYAKYLAAIREIQNGGTEVFS